MIRSIAATAAVFAAAFSAPAFAHGEGHAAHFHPHGFEYLAGAALLIAAGVVVYRLRQSMAARRIRRDDDRRS